MNVQELLQERAKAVKDGSDILENLIAAKRGFTPEEKEKCDKIDARVTEIDDILEKSEKFKDNLITAAPAVPAQQPKAEKKDTFDTAGEFFQAVAAASSPVGRFKNSGQIDPRLLRNAASGASANVPADGGFLIGTERSEEIMRKTYETGEILKNCAVYEIGDGKDTLEVPYLDESARTNGYRWGGFRAYREGEVDAATASNAKIGLWECRVSDVKGLVYVTERLLEDAPAIGSLMDELLPQEFSFKLEDEILNGEGGAQCKGIIGDPCTVNITKETGQAADTIVYENIVKMWARCWGRSRSNAAWYINQDAEPQLLSMVLNVGTSGIPVYMPANGLSTSPYATLLGRPVKPIEQCATVGTEGDIILADFSQYALVRKGGLKSASSIHVKFIYDEMTFKFNMRVNGKPKWKTSLTPFKGSSSLSPFVTVDDRD